MIDRLGLAKLIREGGDDSPRITWHSDLSATISWQGVNETVVPTEISTLANRAQVKTQVASQILKTLIKISESPR